MRDRRGYPEKTASGLHGCIAVRDQDDLHEMNSAHSATAGFHNVGSTHETLKTTLLSERVLWLTPH